MQTEHTAIRNPGGDGLFTHLAINKDRFGMSIKKIADPVQSLIMDAIVLDLPQQMAVWYFVEHLLVV